jgi:hypothetical protein
MTTVSRSSCKSCCGRFYDTPCCGLLGKYLCLTVICPPEPGALGGGTISVTSLGPVSNNPRWSYKEICSFSTPWFYDHSAGIYCFKLPWGGISFHCTSATCDADNVGNTNSPACTDLDHPYYSLDYLFLAGFMNGKRATSCNPFYWEYTYEDPIYWNPAFTPGTRFIITEGPCPGSGTSGAIPGSTPGSTPSSGSGVSPGSTPGSTPSDCSTATGNYILIGTAGRTPDGLSWIWRYMLNSSTCPPECPSPTYVDVILSQESEPSQFLQAGCGTPGGGGGSIVSGGSVPFSGFSGPTSGPISGGTSGAPTSGSSATPGSNPASGGSTAGSTPPPQTSGPWMVLE